MPADLAHRDLHHALSSPVFESMTFLNEISHRHPDAISFAAGRPHEEFFDTAAVHQYLRIFEEHLTRELGGDRAGVRRALLQYGPTKGIINDLVARHLAVDEGIHADPESIVVTVGCQEAIYLVVQALRAGSRDVLLSVTPGYVGLAGAAALAGIPVLPVAETSGGIDLDDLVRVLRHARRDGVRPRACYLMPDLANPSGSTVSEAGRERLLQIAGDYDLLLLEDNPYGIFREGAAPPTLKALDRDRRVVYLSTFAKSGIPGARVGFAVADQTVAAPGGTGFLADQLAKLKSMLTVNTSPIAQAVIGGKLLAHDCSLRVANAADNELYQRNRRLLLDELARRFPRTAHPDVTWNAPDGGFFAVLELPFEAGDEELEQCAREHAVLFTPMHHFYGDDKARRQVRLSFSNVSQGQIREGIDRLARFVRARTNLE